MNPRMISLFVGLGVVLDLNPVQGDPIISEFNPIAGGTGDQVLLSGSGFSSKGLTVRFWNGGSGVVATIVFVNSDTLMTVRVPQGITTGPISILQSGGTIFSTTDDFLAIGPGPYILGFSPTFGGVGDTVVLNGIHFATTSQVLFGGAKAADLSINAAGTQITTSIRG